MSQLEEMLDEKIRKRCLAWRAKDGKGAISTEAAL